MSSFFFLIASFKALWRVLEIINQINPQIEIFETFYKPKNLERIDLSKNL